jgi:hypothetical protein
MGWIASSALPGVVHSALMARSFGCMYGDFALQIAEKIWTKIGQSQFDLSCREDSQSSDHELRHPF